MSAPSLTLMPFYQPPLGLFQYSTGFRLWQRRHHEILCNRLTWSVAAAVLVRPARPLAPRAAPCRRRGMGLLPLVSGMFHRLLSNTMAPFLKPFHDAWVIHWEEWYVITMSGWGIFPNVFTSRHLTTVSIRLWSSSFLGGFHHFGFPFMQTPSMSVGTSTTAAVVYGTRASCNVYGCVLAWAGILWWACDVHGRGITLVWCCHHCHGAEWYFALLLSVLNCFLQDRLLSLNWEKHQDQKVAWTVWSILLIYWLIFMYWWKWNKKLENTTTKNQKISFLWNELECVIWLWLLAVCCQILNTMKCQSSQVHVRLSFTTW